MELELKCLNTSKYCGFLKIHSLGLKLIVGIPINESFMAHLNRQGSGDEYGYGDEFWEKAGLLGIHAILVGVGVFGEPNLSYMLLET